MWGITAGTIPIIFAMPFEMKEVGPALGGTAMALIFVAGNLGGFIFPALTAYIAKTMDPTAAMLWIGVLCGLIGYALTGLLIWGVRETGHKAQAQ
jgi:nitrate/nitrite transporter NarK